MADEWRSHDGSGMPKDLKPDTIVVAELEDGHVLGEMPAADISWCCPGDDVVRYRVIDR